MPYSAHTNGNSVFLPSSPASATAGPRAACDLGTGMTKQAIRLATRIAAIAALSTALAACGLEGEKSYPTTNKGGSGGTYKAEGDSIFGEDGIKLFGDGGKGQDGPAVSPIGVNSYLWRASLDTLSFMPLASADPFGGVIITDWYSPPEAAGERFKMTVYILDRQLRADGLRVSVFKQRRLDGADWIDSRVEEATGTKIENAILTRARQLRSKGTAQ